MSRRWQGDHRMPESFKAFCRIVSLTAAKTRRMLVVSVAWVRLEKDGSDAWRCRQRTDKLTGDRGSDVLDLLG
jgi:hypothetical protein